MNPDSVDILLVEDNPEDAELAIHQLKKHNMANQLVHVCDGEEALEFIFGEGKYAGQHENVNSPKLILLDIKMPKVNGMEVLERIKADKRTKNIPVVILTSSKEDPDIQECYKLGVNSYVVKPVDFEQFIKAVSDLGLYWMILNQPVR